MTTSDSKPKHFRFRYRFLIYFVIFILAAIYMVNNNAPTGSAPAAVPNASRDMCINAIRASVNNPSTLDIHMITGYAAQTSGDGIIASLKDYSRSSAVEYQIKGLGIASLYITGITGQAAAELAKIIAAQIRKLPAWGHWAGVALVAFLILNPKSRDAILEGLRSFMEGTAVLGEAFFKALVPLIAEHDRAKKAAASALASIEDSSILIKQ